MPLVRLELRNEYGLGAQELYRAHEEDDPKALLEGVAVAGLVGILRQLGDLADFAAEVFHDLQEQVVTTATRSRKMIARVQGIEAALPSLEKAVLSQTSHIHFAYTAGCDWHPKMRTKQKHVSHSDLPRFIMDSYEECRDPPRLHLLDKFDIGAPGACLRRYSDPSFFRKSMNKYGPLNSEKDQRQKKGLKSKKKHSRRRNEQLSRAVSISQGNGDGSFPFTSSKSCAQSSTGETTSAIHIRSNSGLGDSATSFDSRGRSGYIECIFDVSSSRQSEDQEHNTLQKSMLEMRQDGLMDSVSFHEQERPNDYSAQSSLQESKSSSVTWDEKTEIVKSGNHQMDNSIEDEGEAADLLLEFVDLGKLKGEDTMPYNVDLEGAMFACENSPNPFSEGNQFDEAGSETDRYMDALNSLESEVETDSECHTKREVVQPLTNSKDEGLECLPEGMNEKNFVNSEPSPVYFEEESNSFSTKQVSQSISNFVSSEDLVHTHPPEVTGTSSNPEISVQTDFCASTDILDNSRSSIEGCESFANNLPSASSVVPSSQTRELDNSMSGLCESEESLQEISDSISIKVWTNGGLLGLEPSKPQDYSASTVNICNSVAQAKKNEPQGFSCNNVRPESHRNGSLQKLDASVKDHEKIENNQNSEGGRDRSYDIISHNYLDQQVIGTEDTVQPIDKFKSCKKKNNDVPENDSSECVSTLYDSRPEKSEDLCQSTSITNFNEHDVRETSLMTCQRQMPVISGVKSQCKEDSHDCQSSFMGLRQKLFVTGLQRNGSFVCDDTSQPPVYNKSGLPQLKDSHITHQTAKRTTMHNISPGKFPNEQPENGSPVGSFSSSPPLDHMKISFHPMDGFEISKLKLKFPGGHQLNDNIKDVMFPSFQLLPGPTTSLQDIDSESENDTFCRSSSYSSEELINYESESSSEQWGSGEISTRNDHDIYDALRRISSSESISSAFELDGINHGSILCDSSFRSSDTNNEKSFHSDPLFDLPSFDNVVSISGQKNKCGDLKDNNNLVIHCSNVPTPAPPLPPVGWRVAKPNFDVAENVQGPTFEDYSKDEQVEGTAHSQQSNAALLKQPNIKDFTACLLKNKDQQKLNGSKEVGQAAKGKVMAEMEGLLHHCRTKVSVLATEQDQQKLDRDGEAGQASNRSEMDGRGDLLHQIRTKSFNLRRTTPAKPSVAPDPATNTKVTAILEKANAIRQAYVGSDEGGDHECWSDG